MSDPGKCSRVIRIPQPVKVENVVSSAECLNSNSTDLVCPEVQKVVEKRPEVQKVDEVCYSCLLYNCIEAHAIFR